MRIVPGLYLSHDTAQGSVTLRYRSAPGQLLALEAGVTGTPRWLTLNLDLGTGRFAAGDTIGIVAELEADSDQRLGMFIRSYDGEASRDTPLTEELPVAPTRHIVTALHTVGQGDGITGSKADGSEAFHMLAIALPKRALRLTLHDLGLFVLPAGRGLRAHPMTLGNSAG